MKQSSLSTRSRRRPAPDRFNYGDRPAATIAASEQRGKSRWLSVRIRALPWRDRNRRAAWRRPDKRAIAVAQIGGADQDAGVDIAVEREHADSAAVPAARVLFQTLDGMRSGFFGRADQGHRPHVAQESVERIEAWFQNDLSRDRPCGTGPHRIRSGGAPITLHGAGLADAALIVTVHVGTHGQLGFFLGGIQQLANVFCVAAWDRPCGARCRQWGRFPRDGLPRARTFPAMRRSVAHRRTGSETHRGWGWRAARARTNRKPCRSRAC